MEEVIETMAGSAMGGKTLVALTPHRTSKNVTVRTMTARYDYSNIIRFSKLLRMIFITEFYFPLVQWVTIMMENWVQINALKKILDSS